MSLVRTHLCGPVHASRLLDVTVDLTNTGHTHLSRGEELIDLRVAQSGPDDVWSEVPRLLLSQCGWPAGELAVPGSEATARSSQPKLPRVSWCLFDHSVCVCVCSLTLLVRAPLAIIDMKVHRVWFHKQHNALGFFAQMKC